MSQSPPHRVTNYCAANRARDDETRPDRLARATSGCEMDYDERPTDTDTLPYRAPKLLSPPQPALSRQHPDPSAGAVLVRRRGGHGPCGGAQRRSRGRRECACAAGNHAYALGGGCWAEKCASRCMLRIYGGQSVMDRRPPGARAPQRTANRRFVGPIHGTRRGPAGSNWRSRAARQLNDYRRARARNRPPSQVNQPKSKTTRRWTAEILERAVDERRSTC